MQYAQPLLSNIFAMADTILPRAEFAALHRQIVHTCYPDARVRETQENLSDTKIVAMSGKLTDGQAANLRNQGYDGFLKKPFQVRQVVEAIEASLNLAR